MRNQFIPGLALAVAAAASVLLGDALGLELVHVTLLGVAAGAALVLVPDRSQMGRIAGLAVGVLVTWIAYGLRAAWLPDTDTGRAVAFAGVFAIAGLVAAVSFGRLPLWSILLGTAVLAGAYEDAFAANTPLFASESVVAVTSVLLTTLLGVVVAALTRPVGSGDPSADTPQHRDMEEVPA